MYLNDMNSLLVEGRLTRDPESRTLPSGSVICNLPIASNRYFKVNGETKSETLFIDVQVWGNNAVNCGKYLEKGCAVRVVGDIRMDSYMSKEGKQTSHYYIRADHVEFRSMKEKAKDPKTNEEVLEEMNPEFQNVF